jgi:hypothetical protein
LVLCVAPYPNLLAQELLRNIRQDIPGVIAQQLHQQKFEKFQA